MDTSKIKWYGPFPISEISIVFQIDKYLDAHHTTRKLIGVYLYGIIKNGEFVPLYVGRSDSDLKQELKTRYTTDEKFKICTHYMFCVLETATDAYELESILFHKAYKLNDIHPAKPKDNGHYKCPVEGCEYHE